MGTYEPDYHLPPSVEGLDLDATAPIAPTDDGYVMTDDEGRVIDPPTDAWRCEDHPRGWVTVVRIDDDGAPLVRLEDTGEEVALVRRFQERLPTIGERAPVVYRRTAAWGGLVFDPTCPECEGTGLVPAVLRTHLCRVCGGRARP